MMRNKRTYKTGLKINIYSTYILIMDYEKYLAKNEQIKYGKKETTISLSLTALMKFNSYMEFKHNVQYVWLCIDKKKGVYLIIGTKNVFSNTYTVYENSQTNHQHNPYDKDQEYDRECSIDCLYKLRKTLMKKFKTVIEEANKKYAIKNCDVDEESDSDSDDDEQAYVIYYELDHKFHCLNSRTDKIKVLDKLPDTKQKFHVIFEDEASHDMLRKWKEKFQTWVFELKTRNRFNIDYLKYYGHAGAITCTLKRLCPQWNTYVNNHVTMDEYDWQERNFNGGLQFCEPGEYYCYGYDFSCNYASILGSDRFIFPIRSGKAYTITELPDKLQYGYYKVKITSENKHIGKLLAFSPEHVYTNTIINWCRKLIQKGFDINMELIQSENNCYLYQEKDLIKGSDVFGDWFKKLSYVKKDFPQNKLIKYLVSGTWGYLIRNNKECLSADYIEDNDLWDELSTNKPTKYRIIDHVLTDEQDYYMVLNSEQPMRTGFGRIKSFLTAYARIQISSVALQDIEHVVRIQTDGIVFSHLQERFLYTGLLREWKTSGKIEWINTNKWHNKDNDTKHGRW